MTETVKEFFDRCADEHGADPEATCPDKYYREIEIREVTRYLKGDQILDVGCGNGYSTIRYKQAFPSHYIGLDYSEKMLEIARQAAPDIVWIHGDVLDFYTDDIKFPPDAKFSTIVSCRCLINLASWEQQQQAMENMISWLRPGGRLILVENFLDGLQKLNSVRVSFGLDPIPVRWHNRYLLMDEVLEWVEPKIGPELRVSASSNIGGLYYLLSRVVHAKLSQLQGAEPAYEHPINEIASKMPHVECPYSANYLIVLDKVA
jgi:SAM-dependent methyltransferase